MTHIESNTEEIHYTAAQVYAFLKNCNNHQKLMPAQVVNWKSTETECSFTIQGTADLYLRIKETDENRRVVLEPHTKVPFPFTLTWEITDKGQSCAVKAVLDADMNMFIKMVASKPLENFLIYQATHLSAALDEQKAS